MATSSIRHDQLLDLSEAPSTLIGVTAREHVYDYPRQAFGLLRWGFAALPIVAGADKFLSSATNWTMYISPVVAHMVQSAGLTVGAFMQIVGAIEILAGLLVAFRPRIGAYVVAGWLVAIAINLAMTGNFYDVALRDIALAVGAVALGRLSERYDYYR